MRPSQLVVRAVAVAAGILLLCCAMGVAASTEAAPPASSEHATAIALSTTTAQSTAFGTEVLKRINTARATTRKCGTTTYKAAKPLTWNTKLAAAAYAHSKDMSVRNYFSHTTPGGTTAFQRIKAAGYRYLSAGETIAAGYATPRDVVTAWLKSASHCKILMSTSYTQVGVGFYSGGGRYRNYTTADFGRPA